jgi:hypothetical protein
MHTHPPTRQKSSNVRPWREAKRHMKNLLTLLTVVVSSIGDIRDGHPQIQAILQPIFQRFRRYSNRVQWREWRANFCRRIFAFGTLMAESIAI